MIKVSYAITTTPVHQLHSVDCLALCVSIIWGNGHWVQQKSIYLFIAIWAISILKQRDWRMEAKCILTHRAISLVMPYMLQWQLSFCFLFFYTNTIIYRKPWRNVRKIWSYWQIDTASAQKSAWTRETITASNKASIVYYIWAYKYGFKIRF